MIAIVQNDSEVPRGTLTRALEDNRCPYRLVELFSGNRLPAVESLSGAVVLGGIMSVNETERFPFLVDLKKWIGECLRNELPFLGICLGGQLLAEVGGGKVHFRTSEEFGCGRVTLTDAGIADPLFLGVESPFVTFFWHNDCFVPPPDAIHLASTPRCTYQAFRCGPHAYGLQFHPEVDREIVASWCELAEHRRQFTTDFAASENVIHVTSSLLFRNFIDLVRSRPTQ